MNYTIATIGSVCHAYDSALVCTSVSGSLWKLVTRSVNQSDPELDIRRPLYGRCHAGIYHCFCRIFTLYMTAVLPDTCALKSLSEFKGQKKWAVQIIFKRSYMEYLSVQVHAIKCLPTQHLIIMVDRAPTQYPTVHRAPIQHPMVDRAPTQHPKVYRALTQHPMVDSAPTQHPMQQFTEHLPSTHWLTEHLPSTH